MIYRCRMKIDIIQVGDVSDRILLLDQPQNGTGNEKIKCTGEQTSKSHRLLNNLKKKLRKNFGNRRVAYIFATD